MYRYKIDIFCPDCERKISSSIDESCVLELPYFDQVNLNDYIKQHKTILHGFKCEFCGQTNTFSIRQLSRIFIRF